VTTLGATILETDRDRAPMLSSVTAFAGLSAGTLGAGVLVTFAPAPEQLIFIILLALSVIEAQQKAQHIRGEYHGDHERRLAGRKVRVNAIAPGMTGCMPADEIPCSKDKCAGLLRGGPVCSWVTLITGSRLTT
jgi:hypothetical protein